MECSEEARQFIAKVAPSAIRTAMRGQLLAREIADATARVSQSGARCTYAEFRSA